VVRKLIDVLILVVAVVTLYVSVASRVATVHWRFTPTDSASGASSFTIRGEKETVGFETSVYYVADPPPATPEPWVVNDRVFKIASEVRHGSIQVSWLEGGVAAFAGVRHFRFGVAWWAATICSLMAILFVAAAYRRGLRQDLPAEESSMDDPTGS
jgi:hypothetical protein